MFRLLPLRRGNRDSESDLERVADDAAPTTTAPGPVVRWSGGSALATKAWTVGLWLLLLSGPTTAAAVIFGNVTRPDESNTSTVVAAAGSLNDPTVATELGDRAVRAWLTTGRGQEDSMPVPLPGYTGHAKPFQVGDLTVAGIRLAEPGVWSVTYAVQVIDNRKRSSRQYVQVPVRLGAAGGTVLALPSLVAAPRLTDTATDSAYRRPLAVEGLLGDTVAAFLAAFTSDAGGDVTRYLSPDAGSRITAVTPAPFTAIEVTDLAADEDLDDSQPPTEGQQVDVLVTAVGRTGSGQELPLGYAITLRGRDARWEVDELQIAPTPNASDTGQAGPSATPTTSPRTVPPR